MFDPRVKRLCNRLLLIGTVLLPCGCGMVPRQPVWKQAVTTQTAQLGYRNWIVVAEASFPAQSRVGIRQVAAEVEIPEAVDYVLTTLERTQHVSPSVFLTRELRAVENDYAPGIDPFRKHLTDSLHSYESVELDQQSLLTLIADANQSFDVLVIRTTTALPYTSVFIELQPGYWDAESESRLRERIHRERMERLTKRGY